MFVTENHELPKAIIYTEYGKWLYCICVYINVYQPLHLEEYCIIEPHYIVYVYVLLEYFLL